MKVILATDGSRYSQAALDKCCEIFEGAGDTEIHVLTVLRPMFVTSSTPLAVFPTYASGSDTIVVEAGEKIANESSAAILGRLPSIGSRLTSRVVAGKPEQVIVEEAEKLGADLIIVGSHGAGYLERSLIGSVSDRVVHHAPCSVLVVKASEREMEIRA